MMETVITRLWLGNESANISIIQLPERELFKQFQQDEDDLNNRYLIFLGHLTINNVIYCFFLTIMSVSIKLFYTNRKTYVHTVIRFAVITKWYPVN